ncbi:GNAT family N-acetyltransferase [Glaciecola sp. MH2013]|uniref:GNAT family N-acetyltransferase n=1 Tax=Glaciecola sp. MH2013 TaxID=2785524 RepID=UPI0018A105C6|nr:GNAT family N-acetyltransferase [Glaciecola sp. MH2013]MBF7073149.1 GNAT family N-acetyltransferase [Glaciecola sp. MH2013]
MDIQVRKGARVESAAFAQLNSMAIYQALKLRSDVFVVEQNCVYPDLDDKDIHEEARHISVYADETDTLVAYARCLPPGVSFQGASIGRVVVHKNHRGKGLAREIMLLAIAECQRHWPDANIEIGAQVYLQRFYSLLGFQSTSEAYDEDGIMHINMMLKAEQ